MSAGPGVVGAGVVGAGAVGAGVVGAGAVGAGASGRVRSAVLFTRDSQPPGQAGRPLTHQGACFVDYTSVRAAYEAALVGVRYVEMLRHVIELLRRYGILTTLAAHQLSCGRGRDEPSGVFEHAAFPHSRVESLGRYCLELL